MQFFPKFFSTFMIGQSPDEQAVVKLPSNLGLFNGGRMAHFSQLGGFFLGNRQNGKRTQLQAEGTGDRG